MAASGGVKRKGQEARAASTAFGLPFLLLMGQAQVIRAKKLDSNGETKENPSSSSKQWDPGGSCLYMSSVKKRKKKKKKKRKPLVTYTC